MSTRQKTLSAANAGTVTIGDLTVNRLGFGAMRITGEGIWGEPRDRAEAKRVLQRAVELDVDLIDTADSYGPEVSERLIGETLWPYKPGLVIATKGGYVRSGPNRWTPNLQPRHLREALDGSLRRLKLDRIDVYQLHNMGDPTVTLAEAIGTLAEMQREGKIRHIGVSNFSVAQLTEASCASSRCRIATTSAIGHRRRCSPNARRLAYHFCPGRRSAATIGMPPWRSRTSRGGMPRRPTRSRSRRCSRIRR